MMLALTMPAFQILRFDVFACAMGRADIDDEGVFPAGDRVVDLGFAADKLGDGGPGFGGDGGCGEVFVNGHVHAAIVIFSIPRSR
jgi:hypothetical protein